MTRIISILSLVGILGAGAASEGIVARSPAQTPPFAHLTIPKSVHATRALIAFYDLHDLTRDQLHLSIAATGTWIDEKMLTTDVMAVVTGTPPNATARSTFAIQQDFTTDKTTLHAALTTLDAETLALPPPDPPAVFKTMAALCDELSGRLQSRVLFFFSAGLSPTTARLEAREAESSCRDAVVSLSRVDPHQLTIR